MDSISNLYRKINSFDKINIILISLIPISLVTGPAIPDIIITISVILFLISVYLNRDYFFLYNKFFLIFVLFYLYLLLSSFLSDLRLFSLHSSLFYLRFSLFCFCLYYLIRKNEDLIIYIIFSLSFIMILIGIDGYFQYFNKYNFLGYEYTGERLSGVFGEEKKLGSFLSRLLPLLISLLIYKKFFNKNFIIYITIVLSFFMINLILITGERTALFSIFFFLFLCTFLLKFNFIYKFLIFLTFTLSLLLLVMNDINLKKRIFTLTINQIKSTTDKGGKFDESEIQHEYLFSKNFRIFSIQHESHYISALKMFNSNKIFGIGPRLFRVKCNDEKYYTKYGCSTHPHNFYFQLLSETGIIGFLFLFILFIRLSYYLIKIIFIKKLRLRESNYKIAIMITIYVSIWPFIPNGNFFNNWLNIILYLPFPFMLFFLEKENTH